MKTTILAFAGCMTLLAVGAWAHDEEALMAAMKTIGGANGNLRKAIAAKDGAEAAANAEKLSAAFKIVLAHFEEHHMEDGVKFSQTSYDAAVSIPAATKAGDWDKVSDAAKTIGGQCQGCHAAHREKLPDGTYKMK